MRSTLRFSALVAIAATLAGCGGTLGFVSRSRSLAAATNTICVTPQAQPQTVTLPSTGGVTGTISFGSFPAGATGCDVLRISTGAAAETQAVLRRELQAASTTNPQPVLTISVGEAFGSNPVFGTSQIISGMQLMVAPELSFPDGTYSATITDTGLAGPISSAAPVTFTAKNGVLTVTTNPGTLPFVVVAHSSAILKLYARGVEPPNPSTTPTATPSTSPTPGPTASPTVTPTPAPTLTPTPSPSGSATATPTPGPSGTSTATPAPTPSPAGTMILLQEGQFTTTCNSQNNCSGYSQINSLIIYAQPGSFTLDVHSTDESGNPHEIYGIYSINQLHSDKINGNPYYFAGGYRGYALTEGSGSTTQAVSTNDPCESRLSGCVLPIFFDTQARKDTFNAVFANYRGQQNF